MRKQKFLRLSLFAFVLILAVLYSINAKSPSKKTDKYTASTLPVLTPSPSPTPRPLTFKEMNQLYGPCVYLPVLMYHHIQDMNLAKTKNQQNLTVDTEIFAGQMQYLKDKGYQTLAMSDLSGFFVNGSPIPKKSILLTFDDAYDDFYSTAYPIINRLSFRATVFVPTGLVGNPGYLSWNQIGSMGNILFANHTWSHKSMNANGSIDEKEISLADTQLTEKGYDNPKVFAYPYGNVSTVSENILSKYNYTLAFSTRPGSTLCKKQTLALPRVRIGNTSLDGYGF